MEIAFWASGGCKRAKGDLGVEGRFSFPISVSWVGLFPTRIRGSHPRATLSKKEDFSFQTADRVIYLMRLGG